MQGWLRDGVHAVRIGAELVFLDVAADSYLALSVDTQALDLDMGCRRVKGDPDFVGELKAAGLVAEAPGSPLNLRPLAPPRCFIRVAGTPSPADLTQAVALFTLGALRFRRLSLSALVDEAARGRRGTPPVSAATVRRASIFSDLLVWSPWQGRCLWRSYLLLRFLRAGGDDATWVFGVRTWPFAAHCWLQVEDVVLNDHPERVAVFTPILWV